MKKLRVYLRGKFKVSKAILFMGDDPRHAEMREKFKSFEFEIITKPHIEQNGKIKGNCDAELVLHACKIEYPNYDKAVIITGDGDFFCLVEDLIKENKLESLLIPNEFRYSSLYKKYIIPFGVFVSRLDSKLSHKKFIPPL